MDARTLSTTQKAALEQLQTLTDGGDPDVTREVLESVDWDVSRAAGMIFDGGVSTKTRPATIETFEIDDSEQGPLLGGNSQPAGASASSLISRRSLIVLITFPFNLLSNILRFLFGVLHIPFPRSFSSLNFMSPRGRPSPNNHLTGDPKSIVDRWVRSLEEETGAVCVSRAGAESESTAVAGPSSASTSNLRHRGDAYTNGRILPDFYLGGYEEAMRTCQKDLMIGCIILVSEEHEDIGQFKRTTLTDPRFVNFLQTNNFLVWGGDIRDKDAWSTSQKLQATTYPFIAFAALQPRRTPSTSINSSTSPTMTILSRHAGLAATTSEKLLSHLQDQLIPRVKPFLDRLRNEERRRVDERIMREEQDRAYREAMNRDKDRIERKIREEAAEKTRLEQEQLAEEKRLQAEEEEDRRRKAWQETRMSWRRYIRHWIQSQETHTSGVRIGIRLPNGKRAIRIFQANDSVTSLFAFVDSQLIPDEFLSTEDPTSPPRSSLQGEAAILDALSRHEGGSETWWGFKLALTYPRKEIQWERRSRIGNIEGLGSGGQLVVEIVNNGNGKARRSQESLTGSNSDEYDTESDEE